MQVKEQGSQKGEASPFLAELLRLEEQAKQQGLGRWSKVLFNPSLDAFYCKSNFFLCSLFIKSWDLVAIKFIVKKLKDV